VILSDYNKGVLHHSKAIVQSLKKAGMYVIVDGKKPLSAYEGADIIKMNEKEYELYNEPTSSTLVVTMGARGVKIIRGILTTEIPGNEVAVSDVTGAGDVFLAAMTLFLERGDTLNKACEKANELSALSVTKFGTYIITEEDVRKSDKKIIFTNGCFDVLHPGHVKYLQESRKLGDKLIVGLNSDRSVKALKGNDRPIHDEQSRKKVLESLECVDEVIIFDEDTPYELIKIISPDIITKGSDYTNKEQVVGNDLADVILIDYDEKFSTTKILEFKK
jgi:D-beta-D-heptose 7-phosphate kinase/D-beta-D-heptose 1-phosphate adenosyltransferase